MMQFEHKWPVGEGFHLLRLLQGDITDQTTDAIVNAANTWLILGAGVAGAIRRRGGPTIQAECDDIGEIEVGGAVITTGGNLRAPHVIHAVGPIWGQYSPSQSQKLLADAVKYSLTVLEKAGLKSITFPALSTGIYGFPKELAAQTMINAIEKFVLNKSAPLFIQICLFSTADYTIFETEAKKGLK